jgi:hypothetical protein
MADDDDQGWVYFVDINSKLVRELCDAWISNYVYIYELYSRLFKPWDEKKYKKAIL